MEISTIITASFNQCDTIGTTHCMGWILKGTGTRTVILYCVSTHTCMAQHDTCMDGVWVWLYLSCGNVHSCYHISSMGIKPPIEPAMADPTRFLQMFTLTRASTLVFRTWTQMEEDRDSGRKWETTKERKREVKLRCDYNVTTPISITYTLH